MRCSKVSFAVTVALFSAAAATAARVDLKDPRRAVGREDDVRVDAELNQDSVSPCSVVGATFQIENFTASPIAFADKVSDASYDAETQTITLAFGAEVPTATSMPHLVTIAPGQTRTFTGGAMLRITVPSVRTPWTLVPRYVQVKVNVLKDITPFVELIALQNRTAVAPSLSNDVFEKWIDNVGSVLLNSVPVRWQNARRYGSDMAAERDAPPPGPGGTY